MPSKAGTKKRGRGSSPGSQNNNGRKKRGLNIPSGSNVNALDQLVVPAPNVRSRDSSMASSTMASSKYIKNNEQRIRLNLAKPVFIEAGSQEIIAEVKKMGLSKDPYFKKTFDGKTQVLCQSPEDKKILIDSLKEHKKFEHFTFSEPKDKPSIYVLKGLDRFECHDVLQQLKDNDIPALKVTFLVDNINSSNKKKFFSPLYLVHFTKSQKIVEQQITLNLLQRNFRTINMLIVKWERFDRRRKRISQCHNCQRFGHSATNCGHKNRCVKCEQSHQPGQCSRQSRDDPGSPKCVNCTGEHPANSSSCQVYKSYAAKVNKIRTNRINIDNFNSFGRSPKTNLQQEHFPKLNQLQEVATSSSSSHIISGSSYANVMKQQKNANDPFNRCSTPFVSMPSTPFNHNHVPPHSYPPHQRLPPNFPHAAAHNYWYSQQHPPSHPHHHNWMMNPYMRNRRGSYTDAQMLPSSIQYNRNVLNEKQKMYEESSPLPKRTKRKPKQDPPSKQAPKDDIMKNVTPLPGFLQTFGGTEIGRFSEAFFTSSESPNPYYNNSIESDVESPQPWDFDSLDGPVNMQVGAAFQVYGSETEYDSPINNFSELICNEY